ncbi:unnamed protein product [Bubo scandiacus]
MSESVAEVPGDGSPAALGETGTSHELLQRLRELEAENSALAQANENQRETYERCLDEVANHVVQALLNQKDLREECIKLKKRVFDLERQNQALSDLFQQKLQLSAGSLPQLSLHPVPVPPDAPVSPQPGSAEQPPPPTAPRPLPHGSPTKLPTKAGAGKAGTPRGEEVAGAKAVAPHKSLPVPEPPGIGGGPPPPPPPGAAAGHSAIEEKVMKGIEENVLRLQGQERAPAGEAKGKAAGGLASWFGLRRSKLPALSRRGGRRPRAGVGRDAGSSAPGGQTGRP